MKTAATAALVIGCLGAPLAARAEVVSAEVVRDFFSDARTRMVSETGLDVIIDWNADGTMNGTAGVEAFEGIMAGRFEDGSFTDSGRWWAEDGTLCWQWDEWHSGSSDCFRVRAVEEGTIKFTRKRVQRSMVHQVIER